MRTVKRTAVLTTLAGLGVVGAVGITLAAGPALAEGPSPAPSSSADAGRPDLGERGEHRAQRRDELAAALAAELGIDKAKVAAALEKVEAARESQAKTDRLADLRARLDAAVKEGKLTAEQSDAILKAAEAGVLPQGGRGGGPGGPGGGGFGDRPGR